MHLQQCPTQIQLPSNITGYNNNLNQNLGYAHDAKALFRHSPKHLTYYSASMPNPNLQNNLIGSMNTSANLNMGAQQNRFGLVANRIRPQFRKCQSQPSRSLSPGSIRSYSPLLFDPLNPAANQYTLNRMYNRNEMNTLSGRANSPLKRQLPQLPPAPTNSNLNSNLNMNLNVTNNYNLHPASFDNSMLDTTNMNQTGYPLVGSRYSHHQPSATNVLPHGHSSALSNYEMNRYKQFSKSSMLLPFNRSLDGAIDITRSSQQGMMYSDSELNRQYHPSSSFDYHRLQNFSQQPYRNQPMFYHQYHRDGDYTSMTKTELDEEMNRNQHRHAKGKQKQQTYYRDVNDAREEQQYLKDQHPIKQQQRSEEFDENEARSNEVIRKRSLRKSSIEDLEEPYDKSFDTDRNLQPTNGSRHHRKLSDHRLDDNEANAITSVDQLDEQLADMGVLNSEDILEEQNQRVTRNGESSANKHRSRIRNKAHSGVINESGGEESEESSSQTKSINSTISDCKKTSRTVG